MLFCCGADLAERALATARRRNLTIVTAESCTAGKLSALLSEAPGAGERVHGSFVTYTKANKVKALGVDAGLLKAKGAVCREVALAMAEGALHRSPADVAVAITGVAGPDPDEGQGDQVCRDQGRVISRESGEYSVTPVPANGCRLRITPA
jgi:PncC family amidohydrolase